MLGRRTFQMSKGRSMIVAQHRLFCSKHIKAQITAPEKYSACESTEGVDAVQKEYLHLYKQAKEHKYNGQTKNETIDIFLAGVMLFGAIAGGGKGSYDGYNSSNLNEYSACVVQTTAGCVVGVCAGIVTVIILPVMIPIGCVVGIIRCFKKPEPEPEPIQLKDPYYTLYDRRPT